MNHSAHVAHLEALSRYGLRQHDAIVFLDHLEWSLLARIRGDEPRRIFPAVDVLRSGTRREELLVPPEELTKRHLLRRALADLSPVEATQFLIDKLSKTPSNAVFLGNLVAPSSMAQTARRFR